MKINFSLWKREAIFNGSLESVRNNAIAFTFDDGPSPVNTLKVLDILDKNNIKGTFFWIVEYANQLLETNPKLFRQIVSRIKEKGHSIGYHALYNFIPSPRSILFGKFSKQEFEKGLARLKLITGCKIKYYRPHTFQFGSSILYSREHGLKTVIGTFPNSLLPLGFQIKQFSQSKAGDILIFHDGRSYFKERKGIDILLSKVALNLRNKNFNFVHLDQILG